jgi:tetratricopeptide (TPR) repeat protein
MARKLLVILWFLSVLISSSSVWAENVSTLLEEGIYAEETKGDLDEAIKIYQKIINDNKSNIASIAKAYYRLGTCYLKTGDEAKAIEFYKKLMNSFPGQIEVVNDAKMQLSKLGALDDGNKPLELRPVPWEAGETCQYDIKTPAGAGAGKMFHSIKELRKDGNNLWRIENYYSVPITGSQIYLRTDVLKEGLIPISSIMKGSITTMGFDYMAIYEKDHIRITNTAKDKKDIPFEGIVYDITQAYEIIRRLPLTENYSTSYNTFNFQSGMIMNGQLTVTGRETVTVPAGTFECYCLEGNFDSTIKAKMWISTDDKKNIVKLEKQGNTTELEKITHETDGEPVEFNDNEFGISMIAPKGWHFVNSSLLTPTPFKMYLDILSPEIKAALNFVVVEHPGPLPSDFKVLKQMFKNFTLRPESWVYGDIDGLPSLTYIADYDSEDKKMVEYRTYVLDNQGMLGSFCLRVEKETFDEIKTDIDSIVQSFKWNKK